MNDYLSILTLEAPLDRDGLRRLAIHACLDLHQVRWPRCYVARDGKRMLCWYQARDAESVRLVLRQQGSAGANVWPVEVADVVGSESLDAAGCVVVELPLGSPDAQAVSSVTAAMIAALDGTGAVLGRTFLSSRDARLMAVVETRSPAAVAERFDAAGIVMTSFWECNRPLTEDDLRRIREDWEQILQTCRESYGGFIHTFDSRSGLAVSAEEREAKFEELWNKSGFAFWFGNFADLMMNSEVNSHACEFLRNRIRARVDDPETARKLLPDHPFGTKRVPLECGYYETYNRSNVTLVDLRETPIERITTSGIVTSRQTHPLDVIVYATGFDAGTGSINRIDVCGGAGRRWPRSGRMGRRRSSACSSAASPTFSWSTALTTRQRCATPGAV